MPPTPPEDILVLPPTAGVDERPSFERALTEADRKLLLSSLSRRPAAALTRTFGTLFGLMPLFLIFMGLLGTSFPPDSFTATVLGTAIVGIAFGAASAAFRSPVLKAIARGIAVETRGVPEPREGGPSGTVRVALGEREFLLPDGSSGALLEGRMNSLTFVDLGPTKSRSPYPGWRRVVLLELNGSAPTSKDCFIPENAEGSGPPMPSLSQGLTDTARGEAPR